MLHKINLIRSYYCTDRTSNSLGVTESKHKKGKVCSVKFFILKKQKNNATTIPTKWIFTVLKQLEITYFTFWENMYSLFSWAQPDLAKQHTPLWSVTLGLRKMIKVVKKKKKEHTALFLFHHSQDVSKSRENHQQYKIILFFNNWSSKSHYG